MPQLAAERPAAHVPSVDIDAAAAEVPDEDTSGEPADSARRERQTPRLVQRTHAADTRDEPAVEIELVDIAAGRGVVPVHGRARRVRDEYAPAGGLDAERRVPGRYCAIDERAAAKDPSPPGVIDVDSSVVEVSRIEPLCSARKRRHRDTAEHRGGSRLADRDFGRPRPAVWDARRPAAQHPVLARIDEPRGRGHSAASNDEAAAAVVDDAGRPAFYDDGERLLPAVGRVQGAATS